MSCRNAATLRRPAGSGRGSRILSGWLALLVAYGSTQSYAGQLGARPAEEWVKTLESPARIERLRISEVVAALRLQPGQVVADLGTGTGLFSLPMAKAVAPNGKVYAVDIEKGLVDYVARKASEQGASNLRPILGGLSDPQLPAADVDVALFHDVLHHIKDRAGYLKNLARYLKPSARIVVVDYRPGFGGHQDDPTQQVTQEDGTKLMAQIGFKPVEEIKLLEDKWFVVFGR
jgi:ubiquinone/menaquinone biosynthesis C-methylase UbiE